VTKRQAIFFYVVVGWTVWVWAVLVRNMLLDHQHGVAFRAVHITLAVISIAFAVGTWRIVRRLRGEQPRD
jgi:hypothetical protein